MPPAPIAWVFTQSPCNDWLPALAWGRGQQTPFSAFNSTWCLGRSCFVGEKVWIFWTLTSGNLEGKNLVFMILQIVISLVSQHIPWNCCVKRDHEWNLKISASVDVFEVEFPRGPFKSGHKPKQHGYDRSIPIKTFAAAKREKTQANKKQTKNFDPPKGFRGESASIGDIPQVNLPTMWSLVSSTFRHPRVVWNAMEEQECFFGGRCWIWSWTLNFGRICLH